MSEPTYVKLLNSIAVNERKGEQLLGAWADATADARLAEVLRFVAIREGEHAMTFTKRLCELGHEVCEAKAYQVFESFDDLLACARSTSIADADKVARVTGGQRADTGKDRFAAFFKDTTIDPETGALLGRYVCEERDSGRRLQAEYDRVCAAPAASSRSEVTELRECVEALRAEIAELKRTPNAA